MSLVVYMTQIYCPPPLNYKKKFTFLLSAIIGHSILKSDVMENSFFDGTSGSDFRPIFLKSISLRSMHSYSLKEVFLTNKLLNCDCRLRIDPSAPDAEWPRAGLV